MSEILAQIYAGNPLSITDDVLCTIDARGKRLGSSYRLTAAEARVTRKAGKGRSPVIEVFTPATRTGGDVVIATFSDMDKAMFFVEALRYLPLLPAAIDELRQDIGKIEKHQLAMRAEPESPHVTP